MFGGSCDDRVVERISGRRSFSRIFESNPKILGGYEAEEITIACRGNFEGTF